jgi:heme exporter protein B
MKRLLQATGRDIARLLPGGAQQGPALSLLLFVAIAILYPFAVGPDPALLARTGGAIIWIAALVASILPLDRLVRVDLDQGYFDQMRLRGFSEEALCAIRILAHWLSFAPLLIVAALLASALLGLSQETMRTLVLGLVAGTPGLAALAVIVAAVMAGTGGGASLAGLLFLPLSIPILIFGAGTLARPEAQGLALTGAVSLVLLAVAPFAAGAAIRAARE